MDILNRMWIYYVINLSSGMWIYYIKDVDILSTLEKRIIDSLNRLSMVSSTL